MNLNEKGESRNLSKVDLVEAVEVVVELDVIELLLELDVCANDVTAHSSMATVKDILMSLSLLLISQCS